MLSELIAYGHDLRMLALPKALVALHCMTVGAGYEQRMNEVYSWNGLQRGTSPFVVIQHTLLGRGQLEFAGVRYDLRPDDTMLVTVPHGHRYWLERGGRWEYFWMVLNGREALRLARGVIDANGPVLRPGPATVDRLADACLRMLKGRSMSAGEASTAAYSAMTALNDIAFDTGEAMQPDVPPALRRIMVYVRANIAKPLHVERLAALAEMSRAHFVRRFAEAVGASPSSWVLQCRLERIERLLIATDMSVAAIAEATGFASANYLALVIGTSFADLFAIVVSPSGYEDIRFSCRYHAASSGL